MAKWGKVKYNQLEELQKRVQKMETNLPKFFNEAVKNVAMRVVQRAINKTPNKATSLMNEWVQLQKALVTATFTKTGDTYTTEIVNNCPYASMVEYGHKSADGLKWVEGRFMLTLAVQEVENELDKIIRLQSNIYLGKGFKI